MAGWIILAVVAYLLWHQRGGLPFGQGPTPATGIDVLLPGGVTIALPIPAGWRVYRLRDGSQVVIHANAPESPGGWVQGEYKGKTVWFNVQTGQLAELEVAVIIPQ